MVVILTLFASVFLHFSPGGLLDRRCLLPCPAQQQREELRVTKEALSSLRQCFRLDDPYQHTLDTIEQSLCTLLERVTSMERQAAGVRPPQLCPWRALAVWRNALAFQCGRLRRNRS